MKQWTEVIWVMDDGGIDMREELQDYSHDVPPAGVDEVVTMRQSAVTYAEGVSHGAVLACKQAGMLALGKTNSLAESELRPQDRYLDFFEVVRKADPTHLTHLADLLAAHQQDIGRALMHGWIEGKNL